MGERWKYLEPPLLFNVVREVIAKAIREEKSQRNTSWKGRSPVSMLADDVILHIGKPIISIKRLGIQCMFLASFKLEAIFRCLPSPVSLSNHMLTLAMLSLPETPPPICFLFLPFCRNTRHSTSAWLETGCKAAELAWSQASDCCSTGGTSRHVHWSL